MIDHSIFPCGNPNDSEWSSCFLKDLSSFSRQGWIVHSMVHVQRAEEFQELGNLQQPVTPYSGSMPIYQAQTKRMVVLDDMMCLLYRRNDSLLAERAKAIQEKEQELQRATSSLALANDQLTKLTKEHEKVKLDQERERERGLKLNEELYAVRMNERKLEAHIGKIRLAIGQQRMDEIIT